MCFIFIFLQIFGLFQFFLNVLTCHIVCVLQLIITDILNIIGAALSITAVVQLSMELAVMNTSSYYEDCYPHFGMIAQEERDSIGACIYYKNLSKVMALLVLCVGMCVHIENFITFKNTKNTTDR